MDANEILDRLMEAKGLKNDAQLARFLDRSPQSISQTRKNGTLDYKSLVDKCADLDLNFLLLGRRPAASAEPSLPDMIFRVIQAGYRVEKKD